MAKDIVEIVNETVEREGIPHWIQFHNIYYILTLSDLYADEVGHDNGNSCASDNNRKDKKKPEQDMI